MTIGTVFAAIFSYDLLPLLMLASFSCSSGSCCSISSSSYTFFLPVCSCAISLSLYISISLPFSRISDFKCLLLLHLLSSPSLCLFLGLPDMPLACALSHLLLCLSNQLQKGDMCGFPEPCDLALWLKCSEGKGEWLMR